ncbi:hypothetical protein E2986_11459 [Frieseomelitta varia]|uniref:Uncharacterized protein n=1 Tax=Frieseomelitta varia TaxID=561572 RepID=A0A833W4C6_9HYME|nr:hypothetical protein E2986_11459 [Frieseomelitta varia]
MPETPEDGAREPSLSCEGIYGKSWQMWKYTCVLIRAAGTPNIYRFTLSAFVAFKRWYRMTHPFPLTQQKTLISVRMKNEIYQKHLISILQ